jgi:hypothetical protein
MDVEPGFVAETLAWCNSVRVERGLEPIDRLPKGLREEPQSCPCGRATGLWVDTRTFGTSMETYEAHPLPRAVRSFVAAFDEGELPQYDEKPRVEDEDW